ncbi:MAG: aminomethyl transferase family protein [Clostridiales bacterium]|nr:aminomethyl transferase family protein [Clostridiales bacterium]
MLKDNDHFPGYVEGIPGLKSCPYVPFDPQSRHLYSTYLGAAFANGVQPWEYTDWRDECRSWLKTCYIHSNLNPHPTYLFKGPDVMKIISDFCVNSVKDWPIGKGKHLILCDDAGYVINDGVGVRHAEDMVTGHELTRLAYEAERGNYDLTVENRSYDEVIYQFCGPKALEIMENCAKEDLHDLKFMYTKRCKILGKDVWIIRMGMAGSLGYEIHCDVEDALTIYNEAIRVGEAYGLRKLGSRAYSMTHWEGGFPQWSLDFPSPWGDDEDYMKYLKENGFPGNEPGGAVWANKFTRYEGSIGPDLKKRLRNPVELGWGGMVQFDHDFVGRKALEKIKANPKRKMVTLVWNKDDIMDVHRSQLESGEPYKPLDEPLDYCFNGPFMYHADIVLKNGKEIGISTGRMNSYNYREMISLCSLDIEHSEEGTEVIVLWGNPETRQKEIRAAVSRYPFLDTQRNQVFDVNQVPRYTGK